MTLNQNLSLFIASTGTRLLLELPGWHFKHRSCSNLLILTERSFMKKQKQGGTKQMKVLLCSRRSIGRFTTSKINIKSGKLEIHFLLNDCLTVLVNHWIRRRATNQIQGWHSSIKGQKWNRGLQGCTYKWSSTRSFNVIQILYRAFFTHSGFHKATTQLIQVWRSILYFR